MLISKPLTVVFVVKLLAMHDELNLQVLFTVNFCIIMINMQAVVNASSYIDTIQSAIKNIESFMAQKEMDLSHLRYTNDTTAKYAVEIREGNFQWGSDDSEPKDDPPAPT